MVIVGKIVKTWNLPPSVRDRFPTSTHLFFCELTLSVEIKQLWPFDFVFFLFFKYEVYWLYSLHCMFHSQLFCNWKRFLSVSLSYFSHPPPPFPLVTACLHLWLFCHVCSFLLFSKFHIQVKHAAICLSLSDLFSLNTIPPPVLSEMARFHFSWLRSSPRRMCTTPSLSVHPAGGTWVASISWLLCLVQFSSLRWKENSSGPVNE